MLIGAYLDDTEVGRRLLTALPRTVVLRAGEWRSPLVPVAEMARDEPGQARSSTGCSTRCWSRRCGSGWHGTGRPGDTPRGADPVVGRALRLIRREPAHPWSVASLAAQVGLSRAAFARRFTELVDEPGAWTPSRGRSATGTGFALSTAFSHVRGVSPAKHRRRVLGSV